jgi:hypothetical protein
MAKSKFNLFEEIDPTQEGWEDELQNRKRMNSQVNFMNQILQQNPDNKTLQNALLEQYLGMVFPQEEDHSSALNLAMDLLDSENPELVSYGQKLLSNTMPSIMSQYGIEDTESATTPTVDSRYLSEFLKKHPTASDETVDVAPKELVRNIGLTNQAQTNPALAQAYMMQEQPTLGENFDTAQQGYLEDNGKMTLKSYLSGILGFYPQILGINNPNEADKYKKAGFSDYEL